MSNFLDLMMSDDTATASMTKLQESLKPKGSGNSMFYRYKNMPYGSTCTVRFLPASAELAANEVTPKFLLPKKVIRLRFTNPDQNGSEVVLTIPVMQMYVGGRNDSDPILKQVTALYNEADRLKKAGKEEEYKHMQAKASYHWVRGECLAQGFVIRGGFVETDPPENPIRMFEIGKQVVNVINATINSDDPEVKLEYWPCHGKKGTNFVIKKTQSGEFPKYDAGSCFSRQTSSWSPDQLENLQKYGLWRLEDFLPQRPTDDEYKILTYIVEQSIAGVREWDNDWEAHLETVKVYRTNQTQNSEMDADEIQSNVANTISRLTGAGTSSQSEIMSSLTNGNAEATDSISENAEVTDTVDAVIVPPTKTANDVRSIVDKIKSRTTGKTASA